MARSDPQKLKQEISDAIKAEHELELVTALLVTYEERAKNLLLEADPGDDASRLKAAVMFDMVREFSRQLGRMMDTGKLARAQLDRDDRRDAARRRQQGEQTPRVQ